MFFYSRAKHSFTFKPPSKNNSLYSSDNKSSISSSNG